jgi:hypothetical protein
MNSITYETAPERARRKRWTLTNVYAQLAGSRIPGAVKKDGRWLIPIAQSAPLQSTPIPDYKSRQAHDEE